MSPEIDMLYARDDHGEAVEWAGGGLECRMRVLESAGEYAGTSLALQEMAVLFSRDGEQGKQGEQGRRRQERRTDNAARDERHQQCALAQSRA